MRKKYHPKNKIELRRLILDEEVELGEIDTSKITDMSHLFEPTLSGGDQARFFYEGIESWDVSNVTDMSYMFCYARNFNADISKWNVSKVKNMRGMFQFATSFNQDISMWNVSNVENMASMFYDVSAFNQNLDAWDISKVKTMRFMFMYARYFEKKPIWDMRNVEDQVGMYYGSPIVYVDPDVACGVDPVLEAQAEQASIQKHLDDTVAKDGIAKFVKNLANKSSNIADRLEVKFDTHTIIYKKKGSDSDDDYDTTVSVSAKEDSVKSTDGMEGDVLSDEKTDVIAALERLKKLHDSGMITDDELALLKNNILSKL